MAFLLHPTILDDGQLDCFQSKRMMAASKSKFKSATGDRSLMKDVLKFCKGEFPVRALIAIVFVFNCCAVAQDAPAAAGAAAVQTQTATPSTAAPNAPKTLAKRDECEEPEPAFKGLEYNGPFKKLAAHVVGKPEIRTVQHPRFESGKRICSLPVMKKFQLFAKDTFEPVTFVVAGFNAGLAQAQNDDPKFGQGAEGYGRRFGAAFADQVSGQFFGTFLYPTILHEDPRYYRRGEGSNRKRLFHAFSHAFVTHSDSGKHTFNFSEWMGAASTTALGNLYHSGNRRGFQPAARSTAYAVTYDIGFDILREFWPELTQHLKLPFVVHTNTPKK
ncbi:MAG: hypothetical protein JWO13_1055 [Acidobacteriales bacterium]|nr:hypothetical protein [Terriglobales bacterium]